MKENNSPIERIMHGASVITTSLVFLGTLGFFALIPVAGAVYAGAAALQATATSGFALQALATVAAGAGGLLAGLTPLAALNHFGKKKDTSYGMLELLCVPAAVVDKALTKTISSLKNLKLSPIFKRAVTTGKTENTPPAAQKKNLPPQP